jgi:hypothetical protein
VSEQPAKDAALWIGMLVQQFPELTKELAPGTGRRGSGLADGAGAGSRVPPPGEAELLRAERRDALLVEQRHGLAVPGHGAAPLRLHVSDAIRDITDGVVELEEAVHARLDLPQPRRAHVPERLRRIGARLDEIAAHPVLARHVRDETRRMARRCARALGDTEQVVRVPGRCPWCDSVSLRAFPARRAVLCVNPACRCGAEDCGCRDDPAYRHLWEEGAWAALGPGAAAEFTAAMEAAP